MTETPGPQTWPAWLREIAALLAVHPQFVLSGNVRDRYRLPLEEMPLAETIIEAIAAMIKPIGYDTLLIHDVVDGYRVVTDDPEASWADIREVVGRDLRSVPGDDLDALSQVIRMFAGGEERRIALALDYASQLVSDVNRLDPREHAFFSACLKFSHDAARNYSADSSRQALYNPVFWIIKREHDLPAWLTAGNRAIREIPVPWPEYSERVETAGLLTGAASDREREHAAELIAARTGGMSTESMFDIVTLLSEQNISYADAEDAVRIYTLGAAESPWRGGAAVDRLRKLDIVKELSSKVFGQPAAITKSSDILRRAALGLSGAQAGANTSRPRGVLFFAGPTGVGKTELAKSLTELVFGSRDAYVRFDMSEFSSEHAGDRLIGAPPGYVGFEGGGELTNAVRRNPYTLLLFDEVEKAHPRILDKFLQMLDDGRLTDGRGTTVHFSDTLIVFTSNLGMTRPAHDGTGRRIPVVGPEYDYEEIEARVVEEIRRHFTEEINRPELLNRVGDNVVVFDFIRSPVAIRIADHMLDNIALRLKEASGITVTISPKARTQLHALTTADLSFGGRGIGNILESRFVNPLARALSVRSLRSREHVEVVEVSAGDLPEVKIQ